MQEFQSLRLMQMFIHCQELHLTIESVNTENELNDAPWQDSEWILWWHLIWMSPNWKFWQNKKNHVKTSENWSMCFEGINNIDLPETSAQCLNWQFVPNVCNSYRTQKVDGMICCQCVFLCPIYSWPLQIHNVIVDLSFLHNVCNL